MKKLVVTCSRGLEPILSRELSQLGYTQQQPARRGVILTFPQLTPQNQILHSIYRINYLTRIGTRVLWPISEFSCKNALDLYQNVKRIDWTRYIPNNKTFRVDSVAEHSEEFKNTVFISQKTKDAIVDQISEKMGSRPNVELDSPHVVVNVHIARGQATVSIDTSGEPLFQRGYRVERGEAPLHETLAAAILFFANFDIAVHSHQTSETKTEDSSSVHSKKELNPTMNRIVLCDPFCGSGTFLAEAAMIMTNTPAGYKRNRWAFFHLPDFSLTEWETVKQQENKQILSLPENSLFGADQSIDMIHAATQNLKRLGFTTKQIVLSHSPISEYCPPSPPNLVITNPPYGIRLDVEEEKLKSVYRSLGDFLKQKCAKPTKAWILSGNLAMNKELGLRIKRRHIFWNGKLESRLLELDIY